MTTRRTVLATTTLVLAAALTGCATFQDVFPVGQREFTYATSADVERSGESFRFQGFLPRTRRTCGCSPSSTGTRG
ncbi:hypothetical protein LFM56_08485 [Cellulomonas iranensis]|uniref:hypothetical protein n=1 Tax=Cellulomonas iranensis TaxID=76862 RepID=UPI001CF1F20B|nr:hypothetical protein [Cellulomonas iranensis]UCN16311.1 hypothetical protein LFM56_08485 [Cellulomonas iranensis]